MSSAEPELPQSELKEMEIEAIQSFKHKRRRRGKKRKFKIPCSMEEEAVKGEVSESGGLSTNECKKRPKKVLIRPVDAPKAPWNSTQFIMDDHGECHLYYSFETPNPYRNSGENSEKNSNVLTNSAVFEDAAFKDIDYVYQSLQDVDNSAFYLKDFEVSYSNMRYEELLRLQKTEIISALESLELRVSEYEDKLIEHDPTSALEQLQQKLLNLQEEHALLISCNESLKSLVKSDEDSHSEHSHNSNQADENGHSHSEVSHSGSDQSYDESDDSYDEIEVNSGSFVSSEMSRCTNDCLHDSHDSSLYLNGTSDFIHIAIDQSSEASYNSCDEEDMVHNITESMSDSHLECPQSVVTEVKSGGVESLQEDTSEDLPKIPCETSGGLSSVDSSGYIENDG